MARLSIFLFLLLFCGCGGMGKGTVFEEYTPTSKSTPNGGIFSEPIVVQLSSDKEGFIFYTTDNSIPDINANPATIKIRAPFTIRIDKNTNVKFFAVDDYGRPEKTIHTAAFAISNLQAPVISTSVLEKIVTGNN
ncbi:chitobiase/beta-hexosaminidase C-terminal domain-containing protein [Candidatus Riflebacteria bacterium]